MQNEITLDEVVNLYLDEGEVPDSLYRRIFTLGIRAYRQIYMHAIASPLTVELEVMGNKTVTLPCDCLNEVVVGIMGVNGVLSPLTKDESISLGKDYSLDRISAVEPQFPDVSDNDNSIYFDPTNELNTPFAFAQLGSGARSDLGFYRIDWDQRLIVLDPCFVGDTIWMEYIPVVNNDGKYIVNPFFVECIIGFINWKDKRNSLADRSEGKELFYNELRIGRRSLKPFQPGQAFLQYNRTTRQARF